MKRMNSKTVQIRKRIKAIQGRAKFVGVLYLLGTIGLAALAACMPLLDNTTVTLSVMKFFEPIKELFKGGVKQIKTYSLSQLADLGVAVTYAIMLFSMLIDILRSISKLGWLFKRRASYSNGFNRNMYAMDDMGKRFSGVLATLLIFNLVFFMVDSASKISLYGYVALAGGLLLHFLCGLIGGSVTLFTMGERVEEEEREHGLLVYFIRNLIQLVVVAALVYFLCQASVLAVKAREVLGKIWMNKAGIKEIEYKGLIPAGVEMVTWLCVFVLAKHATASTEFNRDCMNGAGMRNFAVFSFFTFLLVGALVALPYLNIGVVEGASKLNVKMVIAASVAFVAFLLDCIIKSRRRGTYDDMDMEMYFRESEAGRYNNPII